MVWWEGERGEGGRGEGRGKGEGGEGGGREGWGGGGGGRGDLVVRCELRWGVMGGGVGGVWE